MSAFRFTPDQTQAEYWIDECNGRWRTARKQHSCGARNLEKRGACCKRTILPGERYLDTGEADDNAVSPFATIRHCEHCAGITHAESDRLREAADDDTQ